MSTAIRKNISAKNIYAQAKQVKDGALRARLLAIAALVERKPREEAAKIAGMSVSNLHVWVRRFNKLGFDGLIKKKQSGRKVTFTAEIEQFLKDIALEGASSEKDKRVTYRLEDFQAMIQEKFRIRYARSTIWYALKRLGLSWVSVRQQHPKTDFAAQEEFKKKPPIRLGKYKATIQTKK